MPVYPELKKTNIEELSKDIYNPIVIMIYEVVKWRLSNPYQIFEIISMRSQRFAIKKESQYTLPRMGKEIL